MIITRSPLRITFGGGGTDLASYYSEHEGFLIAAAIDRYVYITVHETFVDDLIVKYSKLERVSHARELEHPIIREAMALLELDGSFMEITSMADIPAGTGLGSSGSFTTALLKALHAYKRGLVHPSELAEEACRIEIDILKEPIGKQDQYIAAYGGVTCFKFKRDGKVEAWPLALSAEARSNLEDNLMMYFTGYSRRAGTILREQDEKTRKSDGQMMANLHFVKEIGLASKVALERGDLKEFGRLMHEHWLHKKKRSDAMSNGHIEVSYEFARKHGALGGKLIGAGGGGFLLFYTEDRAGLRHAMLETRLKEVRFRFDFEGTKVLAN